MAKIYHTKLSPVAWTVTSAQAGYPASNASLESIGRPWRATSAGATDWTAFLAAATTVHALLLEDVNFSSCTVLKSSDGTTFFSVGTLTSYADKLTGRRRGVIVINDANVKAVRTSIGSGSTTDGTTGWRIGAAYLFSASVALARMADYGMKVRAIFPKVSQELANKQIAQASIGESILAIHMSFNRQYDQDVHDLQRRARAATMGLDLELTDWPELVLPVRHVDEGLEEAFNVHRRAETQMELREVT